MKPTEHGLEPAWKPELIPDHLTTPETQPPTPEAKSACLSPEPCHPWHTKQQSEEQL